jgi:hypothetical protein
LVRLHRYAIRRNTKQRDHPSDLLCAVREVKRSKTTLPAAVPSGGLPAIPLKGRREIAVWALFGYNRGIVEPHYITALIAERRGIGATGPRIGAAHDWAVCVSPQRQGHLPR